MIEVSFALIFTTNVPTPPNGRATIRLCRTLSLEQKLPLEVSFISLEMTCQRDRGRNVKKLNLVPTELEKIPSNLVTVLLLEYAYTQSGFSC